jgi:hypothetical protein
LQVHLEEARARFEAEGYTPNQEVLIRTDDRAAARSRGSRLDEFAKSTVLRDPELVALIVAPDFVPEPDFLDSVEPNWYDATTRAAWREHAEKYLTRYGANAAAEGLVDTGRLQTRPRPTGETNL